MVATFMHKAVSKSYVRLPGSGSDMEAGASFCDLSRGSSLASIISVPQHVDMPRYLTVKLASGTVTSTTNSKRPRTEDDTVDANESNKRLCINSNNQNITRASNDNTPKDGAVSVNMSSHELSNITPTTNRANNEPVTKTQNGTRASSDHTINPVAVPVTVSSPELSSNFTPTPTINRANNEPVRETQSSMEFFNNSNPVNDVKKLLGENIQLRSENAILQKQLSLFKQLIRNPQRLQSVLQSLNERS